MFRSKYTATLIALFTAINLFASDSVDLSEVPWTDASHFWSQDGYRLPVKNKNLMGNTISIGGVKYEKGLAGHTGFSVAYNLSGQALNFSAIVGIDDEEHKRDAKNVGGSLVNIVILVDREEVFRKTVAWKDKGIPVSIDLRGKQQIELRGEYGKSGFFRQRPVFANPVLQVKNRADYLKVSEEWHEKVQEERKRSLEYPAAPDWKKFKIEKKAYADFNNSYWISNDKMEMVVAPEFGGRILSFRLKDGKNILTENGTFNQNQLMDRGRNLVHGGHFNRPQPGNFFNPCDPILLFGNYSIEFPSEGEILMTSRNSWLFHLQWKLHIKFIEGKADVEVTNIHKNIGQFSRLAGIWSITRVEPKKATAVLMPQEAAHPYQKTKFTPESFIPSIKKDGQWNRFDLDSAFWGKLKKRESIEWQLFPQQNQIKTRFKNAIFEKSFEYKAEEDDKHMGRYYPAHIYVNKKFIEIESHGPTKKLVAGEEIKLKEKWSLRK